MNACQSHCIVRNEPIIQHLNILTFTFFIVCGCLPSIFHITFAFIFSPAHPTVVVLRSDSNLVFRWSYYSSICLSFLTVHGMLVMLNCIVV